jgi:hypothetical protein
MGLRPTQAGEKAFCSPTTFRGRAALPFVIPTGGFMGLRPTQEDENMRPKSAWLCIRARL